MDVKSLVKKPESPCFSTKYPPSFAQTNVWKIVEFCMKNLMGHIFQALQKCYQIYKNSFHDIINWRDRPFLAEYIWRHSIWTEKCCCIWYYCISWLILRIFLLPLYSMHSYSFIAEAKIAISYTHTFFPIKMNKDYLSMRVHKHILTNVINFLLL